MSKITITVDSVLIDNVVQQLRLRKADAEAEAKKTEHPEWYGSHLMYLDELIFRLVEAKDAGKKSRKRT